MATGMTLVSGASMGLSMGIGMGVEDGAEGGGGSREKDLAPRLAELRRIKDERCCIIFQF